MRHKISTFLFLLLFFTAFMQAQTNFEGVWEGIITMEKENKTLQSFKFILHLSQDSTGIKGRSWIWYKDFKANFEVQGEEKNGQIFLKDMKLIEADALPSGEWCEKNMELIIIHHKKENRLEGKWQGKTTFSQCTPGKVILKKNTDRV